jgi:acetyl-CoA acetyltransferase
MGDIMLDDHRQVAIVGVGHSEIGRRLDRPLGLLAIDASLAAIEDAGLTVSDINGAATFPQYPGGNGATGRGGGDGRTVVGTSWMIKSLGMSNISWWAESQSGNISTAIELATIAIAVGRCDYALIWRALHMPNNSAYQQLHTELQVEGDAAYSIPYGFSGAPMTFALTYMRYQKLYGARREHMAALAIASRKGANLNPHAYFRDVLLTYDDYMESRMIADPLCLYDCDIPVDGAGAIVLARADRARDLRHPPAYVTGIGQSGYSKGLAPIGIGELGPGLFEEVRHTASTIGGSIWSTSGLGPSDVDAAMLYDGFAPDIYFWLEGLGFCAEGEAYEFIQEGRIEIGGELPINTFGGNLSEGRLHGIGHWVEATLQIQGRAGQRQVPGAENVVVATGLLGHGSGAMLSRAPT